MGWLLPPLLLPLLLRDVKIFLLEGGLVGLAVKVVMDDLLLTCQSCPKLGALNRIQFVEVSLR